MLLTLLSSILIVERAGGVSQVRVLAAKWWPAVLIVVALIRLVQAVPWRWALLGPSILMGFGLAGLSVTIMGDRALDSLPLLAFVGLGLLGVLLAMGGSQPNRTPTPIIHSVVWFGTKRIRGYGATFRYAMIRAFFGLQELDLRQMALIGDAQINVTCVFASADIFLPRSTVIDRALPAGLGIGVTIDNQPLSADRTRPVQDEGHVRISVLGFGARVIIRGEDLRMMRDELRTIPESADAK
jgi:hypothetical protein